MSKDIRFAKNKKEAEYNKEYLELTDEVMERMYFFIKNNRERFPLIWNIIEDYYGDNEVKLRLLMNLNLEIIELINNLDKKNLADIMPFLKLFQNLIKNAIKMGSNLYFMAD